MNSQIWVFAIVVPGLLVSGSDSAQDLRQRQTEACMGDAFRLCGDAIPDEDRITACMTARQTELSPGCRAFFTDDTTSEEGISRSDQGTSQKASERAARPVPAKSGKMGPNASAHPKDLNDKRKSKAREDQS
jgi:hypothetical protein